MSRLTYYSRLSNFFFRSYLHAAPIALMRAFFISDFCHLYKKERTKFVNIRFATAATRTNRRQKENQHNTTKFLAFLKKMKIAILVVLLSVLTITQSGKYTN